MTIKKLEELLKQSEGENLDFKLEFSIEREAQKKEFAKDVSAIANSKGGRGYIIFGVEDKTKKIVGVEPKKYEEERIQQLICGRCDPPIPVKLEEVLYKDKIILVLTIYKSYHQPHQILQTGTFYIRRGSTTDIARRSEIAGMMQDNGLVHCETTPMPPATLKDLDIKIIKHFFDKSMSLNSQKSLLMLEAMGIIIKHPEKDSFCPTAGGILLFGCNPQLFLPSTGIKILYNKKTYYFEGNIPTLIDKIESFIKEIFKNTNYPVNAVYEAVYNAVVHRDYWDLSREILIIIEPKKIEIINPGAIRAKEGNIKFDSDINFPRRNPWLYQRLLIWDKKQRYLNNIFGIQNIFGSFENCQSPVKFINLPKKNLFKVVLPGSDEI